MNLLERDVAPTLVSMDSIQGGVVVFAPHPDDEVYGCGGLLALAADRGLPVKVIILTQGELQTRTDGDGARLAESKAAAGELGYSSIENWGLPDRGLRFSEELIQRVMSVLSPPGGVELVLAPSLWEAHPDHRICSMVVAEALRRSGGSGVQLWWYEVSLPLRANVALDVSPVWSRKDAAMRCFSSQETFHPYRESVTGLNRYRALGFLPAMHVEAYARFSSQHELNGWWMASPAQGLKVQGIPASNEDLPLVSVIIRSIGRRTLERAIASVQAQTYPRLEVVLVDAVPAPRALSGDFSVPIRRVGHGVALARSAAANLGLTSAAGEWLVFLDDDDWFYPDHVSKLVAATWRHLDSKVIYSDVEAVDADGKSLGVVFAQPYSSRELRYGNFLPIHSVLFSRELVAKGCRFDVRFDLYEDWDFWLQLEVFSQFIRIEGVSAAYCMGSGAGEGLVVDPLKGRLATQQIFEKWQVKLDASAFDELVQRSLHRRQVVQVMNEVHAELDQTRHALESALREADRARQDAHVLRTAHDAACSDRDRVISGLDAMSRELDQLRSDVVHARQEIQSLNALRDSLRHELNGRHLSMEALHAQRDQLNLRLWQAQDKAIRSWETLVNTQVRIEHLTREVEQTHSRLYQAEREGLIWQQRFQQVVGSRSWWLTRPLRGLTRLVESVRRLGWAGTAARVNQVMSQQGLSGLLDKVSTASASRLDGSLPVARGYLDWVAAFDVLDAGKLDQLGHDLDALPAHPLVSIVMPVFNPPESGLRSAIESVKRQLYGNWELCICDDASSLPHVAAVLNEMASSDSRIKWVRHDVNRHISISTNSAIALAEGEFIAFLDHDDELAPHALLRVVEWFALNPHHQVVYSDEDKLDANGIRFDPYFKSDFNLSLLRSHNFMCHFAVYRKDLLTELGGLRPGFEGAQDHDLALRAVDAVGSDAVGHLPHVLYHWRVVPGSTAGGHQEKSYAFDAGVRAIADHLKRREMPGHVVPAPEAPGMYRVVWHLPEELPLVSIVIPTRNGEGLLRTCLDSLKMTRYSRYEVIVIDNGSDEPGALGLLEERAKSGEIRLIRDPSPFNYSALNNRAVREVCSGEFVLLLNNDIEVTHPEWLDEMVGSALEPGVGCVGARLWYPDGRLQHGGVIMVCGVAGHAHKYLPKGGHGYMGRAVLAQEFLAVTAACLLVRKSIFLEVGGLDESLKVAFNDVDFCLRVRAKGYRNVWTPYAELIHHESLTRGHEDTPEKQARFATEVLALQQRWPEWIANDPCYSPNLTNQSEDFSLAWPPRRRLP